MMRRKSVILILICLISALILVSCSKEPEPEPLPEPGTGTTENIVIGEIPEGSILLFQDDPGAAKLIADMEAGRIPAECCAMYDEMGARPEVRITDPDLITEVYNRLGHMIIGGESDESITDCYHYVYFTLQDGTTVGWSFEGTGLLCRNQHNYEVTSAGSLWGMMREMQDKMV